MEEVKQPLRPCGSHPPTNRQIAQPGNIRTQFSPQASFVQSVQLDDLLQPGLQLHSPLLFGPSAHSWWAPVHAQPDEQEGALTDDHCESATAWRGGDGQKRGWTAPGGITLLSSRSMEGTDVTPAEGDLIHGPETEWTWKNPGASSLIQSVRREHTKSAGPGVSQFKPIFSEPPGCPTSSQAWDRAQF